MTIRNLLSNTMSMCSAIRCTHPHIQSTRYSRVCLIRLVKALVATLCRWQRRATGMMQANLIARVAEDGGDESLTSRSVRYSPYSSYVGVNLQSKEFETDCDLHFPVVTVDASGKSMERNLSYKIYHLDWSWWWEGSANDLNKYVQSTSAEV